MAITNTVVTLSATAPTLLASGRGQGDPVHVEVDQASAAVFVGGSSVLASTGRKVDTTDKLIMDLGPGDDLYAIASSSTPTVRVMQSRQGTPAPANGSAPVVTSDDSFNYGSTWTTTSGVWSGLGLTYTYQWQIATLGASGPYSAAPNVNTGTTYVPNVLQAGEFLRCRVTATDSLGQSIVAYSNNHEIIDPG